jgi:DNA topoisomerase-1
VFAKLGKYGPMVQIGESYADAKPRYARLQSDQFIDSITLEEALDLFRLPRTLGEWNGKDVTVGVGRFGPYVRCEDTFESVPKNEDPYTITLERGIELLESKMKKTAERTPHLVGHYEDKEILAAAGRYGPYIKYDGKNYTLDKNVSLDTLTEEEAIDIIKNKETRNVLVSYPEDADLKVMNGRYGPYITNGTDNFKIPKDMVANKLTYQECLKIMQENAPTAKKRIVRMKKA